MIYSLTAINFLGESINLPLDNPYETGLAITSISGIGPTKATVNVSDLAVSDGGIFNDGTWEFKDNQLIVTKKTNTYVAQGIHDVISWSASTLKMKVWYNHKDSSDPDDYDEWVIFTFNKR